MIFASFFGTASVRSRSLDQPLLPGALFLLFSKIFKQFYSVLCLCNISFDIFLLSHNGLPCLAYITANIRRGGGKIMPERKVLLVVRYIINYLLTCCKIVWLFYDVYIMLTIFSVFCSHSLKAWICVIYFLFFKLFSYSRHNLESL